MRIAVRKRESENIVNTAVYDYIAHLMNKDNAAFGPVLSGISDRICHNHMLLSVQPIIKKEAGVMAGTFHIKEYNKRQKAIEQLNLFTVTVPLWNDQHRRSPQNRQADQHRASGRCPTGTGLQDRRYQSAH